MPGIGISFRYESPIVKVSDKWLVELVFFRRVIFRGQREICAQVELDTYGRLTPFNCENEMSDALVPKSD